MNPIASLNWPQLWFSLLCLCWVGLMLWPSLLHDTLVMSRADNAVMTLMAAVVLAALQLALQAREWWQASLFSLAALLYCGAY